MSNEMSPIKEDNSSEDSIQQKKDTSITPREKRKGSLYDKNFKRSASLLEHEKVESPPPKLALMKKYYSSKRSLFGSI